MGNERGRISVPLLLLGVALAGGGFVAGRELVGTAAPDPAPTVTVSETVTVTPTSSPVPSETFEPSPGCSATGLDTALEEQEGLPAAVVDIRAQIAVLAAACDFEGLSELADAGAEFFSFSFGADRNPARFWREAEAFGDDPMGTLVKVLDLPYCIQRGDGEDLYAWPSAYCGDASDEDWAAVTAIYSVREVRRMKQLGNYIGYRVGITASGDWQFYIAGD